MITKALAIIDGRAEIVDARDAKPGEVYYCPNCGVRLHLARSVSGTAYFKIFPHHDHESIACRKIARDNYVIRSEKKINKDNFVPKLMGLGKRSHKTTSNSTGKVGTETYNEGARIGACNSIEQFYGSGLNKMSPDTPIQDGAVLSDVFISRNQYSNFLCNTTELGYRVLELVPIHAWNGHIRFISYFNDKFANKYRHFFELRTNDQKLYLQAVNMLFEVKEAFRMESNYQNTKIKVAAVASDWHDIPYESCVRFCNRCNNQGMPKYCTGQTNGILRNINQIYIPDFTDNGKKNTAD